MRKLITKFSAFFFMLTMLTSLALSAQVTCFPTDQSATNITETTADLSWGGLTGETWVRYKRDASNNFHYSFADSSNAVSLQNLHSASVYTWEINTLCEGVWSGYGWPQTFTTLGDTVIVVCEPTDQFAANITETTADLSWGGLTGDTWVRYKRDGSNNFHYSFAETSNAVSLEDLHSGSLYTWEINTLCDGFWTGYGWAQTFTTLGDTIIEVCEPTDQLASNVTETTADLSWGGLTGNTWVRYKRDGSNNFHYSFAETSNAVSLENLHSGSVYTWELNTLCGGMWTGYSWAQTFTTLGDTIIEVCEPTDQLASNITETTADLSWGGLTGNTWVRYKRDGSTHFHYSFAETSNAVSLENLHSGSVYTWELNTLCDGMWTGYGWAQTFTTVEDTNVVVCEPTDQLASNVTENTADLSWGELTEKTWVRYKRDGSTHFRYSFADTLNFVNLENLHSGSIYTWELNTWCDGEWTGYGWAQTFTTLEDTTTYNCEPTDQVASNITVHTADLSWGGLTGETWVRYKRYGSPHFHFQYADSGNVVNLVNLHAGSEYTWEINTLCEGQWTGYGWAQTFETLADSSGSQSIANSENMSYKTATFADFTELKAYPNPVINNAVISFSSTFEGSYSLKVVNLLGEVVMEQNVRSVEGTNTLTLNFDDKNAGIYFVVLQQGETIKQLKLVRK